MKEPKKKAIYIYCIHIKLDGMREIQRFAHTHASHTKKNREK